MDRPQVPQVGTVIQEAGRILVYTGDAYLPIPEGVITEHAIGMAGGSMMVRPRDPEIEEASA